MRPMIIPKGRKYDILGIGDADMDFMVGVNDFPMPGQKSLGTIIGKYPGGMTANYLSAAQKFGSRCAGILCVGGDDFGHETIQDLIDRGIDVSKSIFRKDTNTYFTTTCIAPNGEKSMILCLGTAIVPNSSEVDEDIIKESSFVSLVGNYADLCIPIAKCARRHGTLIAYDLERMTENVNKNTIHKLFSLADVVTPNREGLLTYTECKSIEEGAQTLLNYGVSVVVVTKGGEGAELFAEGIHYSVPALADKVIDTTGAGDTFNGCFLSSLCAGYTLYDCLLLASAAAAVQVSAFGCRTKLITLDEARDYLIAHNMIISNGFIAT